MPVFSLTLLRPGFNTILLLAFVAANTSVFGQSGEISDTAPLVAAPPPNRNNDAERVLKKAIQALGGEEALLALGTLKIQSNGSSWIEFESNQPEDIIATSTMVRTTTIDVVADAYRIDDNRTPLFEGFQFFPPINVSHVVKGMVGGTTGALVLNPGTLSSATVAAMKRQQLYFNPHLILKRALEKPNEDLIKRAIRYRWFDIIQIEDQDVADMFVFVDRRNDRILKLVTKASNPITRDTVLQYYYNDWTLEAGQLLFPRSVELRTKLGTLWEEVRSSVEVGSSTVTEDTFIFPVGTDPTLFDNDGYVFGTQSHYFQIGFIELGIDFPFNPGYQQEPVELVPSTLYFLPSSANSLLIRHMGGTVIVEAPQSPTQAAQLVGIAKDLVGPDDGLRVSHVVASHHHVDHGAGIREVLALTNVTTPLVVGNGAKDFWMKVLRARSKVRPDALARLGYYPSTVYDVLEVNELEKATIVDEANLTVSVYHTNRDPHAADAVLVVTETIGAMFVFVVDFYNAGLGLNVVVDGVESFFDALRDIGLLNDDCTSPKPLTIIPGHGIPLALEESLDEVNNLGIDVGC